MGRPAASYDGVARRRTAVFLLDIVILFAIVPALWLLNISTLFVLSAVLGPLGPVIIFLAYDTVLIGGSGSATIGMLLMGLKMVNAEGGKVGYL
ncbi:MAG: RDD family protein [Pseudomonadota bacterium]|nr:RDD family protein [Pseudomonadota bacterium]